MEPFKHPTLNIYFHQYDDWHEREQTYKSLNDKFNGFQEPDLLADRERADEFDGGTATVLLQQRGTPFAEHYEPKATMDCNKTICRETHANPENDLDLIIENPIQAIDAYKQFSTVFYNIFNRTAS